MSEENPSAPTLPHYQLPGVPLPDNAKQQAPLMKLMGKMLAKRLPKLSKGKVSPQSVKIKQKKIKYW